MNKRQSEKSRAEIITDRRRALQIKKSYMNLFFQTLFILAFVYFLITQVFLITQKKGNGMFPAIKDGDLIIAFRLQKEYVKNDTIVFKLDDETSIVGRVVAKETDVITVDDSGTLLVNGSIQRGEIVYPTFSKDGINYPLRIEEDELFVLGDNRLHTDDSRDFGPVKIGQVEGKVITILRRRGL